MPLFQVPGKQASLGHLPTCCAAHNGPAAWYYKSVVREKPGEAWELSPKASVQAALGCTFGSACKFAEELVLDCHQVSEGNLTAIPTRAGRSEVNYKV